MNCSSDLNNFENSWPSASDFKSFSRSLELCFLTVGQNDFGNKIQFSVFSYPRGGDKVVVPQDCHLVKKVTKVISSQHKHTASVSCEKTCVWMHAVDNYGQGFTFNKSELSDLEPDVILESKTLDFSSDDTLVRNIWFFLLSFSQNERKIY